MFLKNQSLNLSFFHAVKKTFNKSLLQLQFKRFSTAKNNITADGMNQSNIGASSDKQGKHDEASKYSSQCLGNKQATLNTNTNHTNTSAGNNNINIDSQEKVLVIFDLDHTILDLNTDVELIKILQKKCPEKISAIDRGDNWALYMNHVMNLMRDEGFALSEIKSFIESLELNAGFKDLFEFIKENKSKFEVIIFSGCNTIFVEWIIQYRQLDNIIYRYNSNLAEYTDNGAIAIKSTHDHECSECDKSQCKQILLKNYLVERNQEKISFKNMVFVGDGPNDFCLTKVLTSNDLVCYRNGFALEKKIQEWLEANRKEDYLCRLLGWNTGFEIIEKLRVLV